MGGVVGAIANPFVAGQAALAGSLGGGGNFDIGQALGAKNGYNAQTAPGTLESLQAGQTGYNNAMTGQAALIQALQAQAAGQGANPAQAMLNQATNQNIAQNTGMIASQKGINPALAVRQASQNAASMGQQAAGQAATMQAQQQIAAQNAQAGVYGNMANQALNQQNIAQQGFYAPQNINAGIATSNAKTNAGIMGGLLGAAGTIGAAAMAHGGMVPRYADGGTIGSNSLDPMSNAASFFNAQLNAPVESFKTQAPNKKKPGQTDSQGTMAGGPMDTTNAAPAAMPMMDSEMTMMAAHGGKVPAMVSPGEKVLSPHEVKEFSHGEKDYKHVGKTVPGKAHVHGDSYENDTVPAHLESGGIVIPRHITQGKNPGEMAKKFVEQELAKNNKKGMNFAYGGEVPDYLQSNEDYSNTAVKNMTDSAIANAQAGVGSNQLPSKEDQFNQRVSDYAKQNNIDLTDPRNKQGVEQLMLNQFKGENVEQKWQQQDVANKAAQDAKFQQEKSDVLGIPQQTPQQSVQNAQSLTQAQSAPVGTGTPNPFGPYQGQMMKALGMQEQAIGQQAQGERQLAQGQLDVLQKQQQDLAKVQQDYDQRYNDIDKETQQAAQDLKNSKIDPNHYWSNKTTPQKFSTAIGLILGGIGSGLTGGENQALKFINAQIDRDIQGQTLNMDKQKNLMSFNMQRLGNLRAAQAATAAMHLQTFQNQLQQEQAKAQNPLIQARATQALAGVQQQKAEYQRQAALFSALGSANQAGTGGGDNGQQVLSTLRMIDPKRAEEMEGRYIPGVGFGSVKIPDKVREEIAGRNELQNGIQKLQKFAQQHQGSLDPATMNEGKALANQVQDAYRRANGQGVFREAEADFVKGVISDDPTAFLAKYRTLPKYKAAIEQNRSALNSKLQAYGFQPARDLSQYEGKPVR